MNFDTSFVISSLSPLHLAFKNSSYWEGYRENEISHNTERFEFKKGWQTIYGRFVESPVVKVKLKDGFEGWGESNCGIGPEVVVTILDGIIGQIVMGQEFQHPKDLWNYLYDAQRGRGYSSGYWLDSMAALDIAIWDAIGKREGLPVAAMLSETPRTKIPVYLSGVRRNTLSERIQHLMKWVDQGLQGVKIFLDGDWQAGIEELSSLQNRVSNIKQWMVDTLWMCSSEQAEMSKLHYGEKNVKFLECPLQPEDLKGHRELSTKPGAPIALGEHFRTKYQLEPWLENPRIFDVYQPDLGRIGISEFNEQMGMMSSHGIETTPHMGTGLSIFQAASLQCAAVSSPYYLQEFQGGLSDKLNLAADNAWKYEEGEFNLPSRPGIGVEIDESKLEPYIIK